MLDRKKNILIPYSELIPRIIALIGSEKDQTANLANITAELFANINLFWVGFYLVKDDSLVLGPFQGPVACTRIQKGKGVCGDAWQQKEYIIVDDVNNYEGHISCSPLTKSELVIPIIKGGVVVAVLDLDSDKLAFFNQEDANQLTLLCDWISTII